MEIRKPEKVEIRKVEISWRKQKKQMLRFTYRTRIHRYGSADDPDPGESKSLKIVLLCTKQSGEDSRITRTAVRRTERHKVTDKQKKDGQTNRLTDRHMTVIQGGSQTRGRKTQERKTETVYKVIRLRADNERIFCLPLSDADH